MSRKRLSMEELQEMTRRQILERWKREELPPIISLASVWNNMPPLAPSIIDGVLRQGHKMLLVGPSKAGKSFALIELALCIGMGGKWLDRFQCREGKVLYINFEIDPASCYHRFLAVGSALGFPAGKESNIYIWNRRGKTYPLDMLAPLLIRRLKHKSLTAVIYDPLYKILTGDENNATDMAYFFNVLERIGDKIGAASILAHHYSKGSKGDVETRNRSSGSGVFARDPDALIDLCPLERTEQTSTDEPTDLFRVTGVLREFPSFAPFDIRFTYPIHEIIPGGVGREAAPEGSLELGRLRSIKTRHTKQTERRDVVTEIVNDYMNRGEIVSLAEIAKLAHVTTRAIRKDLKSIHTKNKFVIASGNLLPIDG